MLPNLYGVSIFDLVKVALRIRSSDVLSLNSLFSRPSAYSNEWGRILKLHPLSLSLWSQYLEFRVSDFPTFSVQNVLDAFSESMEALRSQSVEKVETIMFCIFLRTCYFLGQAGKLSLCSVFRRYASSHVFILMLGYVEKAIALFQALIEFSWFAPNALMRAPFEVRMREFEEWWESETPRFGDVESKGWNAGIFNAEDSGSTIKKDDFKLLDYETTSTVSPDAFLMWYKNEKIAEKVGWKPLCASRSGKLERCKNLDFLKFRASG
jgi:hypothetical protein